MFFWLQFFQKRCFWIIVSFYEVPFWKGIDTNLKYSKLQCENCNFGFRKRVLKKIVTRHP